jgi:hypothetical protein
MSTATMDMPKVEYPLSRAKRVKQMREDILNELRAESLKQFDRMQACESLEQAEGIARGFLARTVGQFDYLGKVERGEA